MTRARDNADGARLDAPLASPTFTGTVAIPNVANLETAVVANTAKVTNYNQTLADINALDITELGTVTSGNLSNTAIVYPAGHIIQITYNSYNATNSDSFTGSTMVRVSESSNYHWTGQITNVGASSHVLIQMMFNWTGDRTGTEVGSGFGVIRGTSTFIMEPRYHAEYLYVAGNSGGKGLYRQMNIACIDTAPDTGTNDYYLGIKAFGSSTVRIKSDSGYEPFRCILQEIKQ